MLAFQSAQQRLRHSFIGKVLVVSSQTSSHALVLSGINEDPKDLVWPPEPMPFYNWMSLMGLRPMTPRCKSGIANGGMRTNGGMRAPSSRVPGPL